MNFNDKLNAADIKKVTGGTNEETNNANPKIKGTRVNIIEDGNRIICPDCDGQLEWKRNLDSYYQFRCNNPSCPWGKYRKYMWGDHQWEVSDDHDTTSYK